MRCGCGELVFDDEVRKKLDQIEKIVDSRYLSLQATGVQTTP